MNNRNNIEPISTAQNLNQIPTWPRPVIHHDPFTNYKPPVDRLQRGRWEKSSLFPRNQYLVPYGGVQWNLIDIIADELWSDAPQYKQAWKENLCTAARMPLVGNVSKPAQRTAIKHFYRLLGPNHGEKIPGLDKFKADQKRFDENYSKHTRGQKNWEGHPGKLDKKHRVEKKRSVVPDLESDDEEDEKEEEDTIMSQSVSVPPDVHKLKRAKQAVTIGGQGFATALISRSVKEGSSYTDIFLAGARDQHAFQKGKELV